MSLTASVRLSASALCVIFSCATLVLSCVTPAAAQTPVTESKPQRLGLGDIDPNLPLPENAIVWLDKADHDHDDDHGDDHVHSPAAFSLTAQQVVLDFDSGTDGSINYTQPIRDAIQAEMTAHYQEFGVTFAQAPFSTGPFSTIFFNTGGPGGLAEGIDFRNLNLADNAVVNVDGIATGSAQSIIDASANIGSHELGHLLGLRHGDAFGPIGQGLSPTGPGTTAYLPTYPGPTLAGESVNHIMASPASIGVGVDSGQAWHSERAAVKLQFAGDGAVITEAAGPNNTIVTAQPITLSSIVVPNTIVTGSNAGLGNFAVDAVVVAGELEAAGDIDMYEFTASEGDLLNFEVISEAIGDRLGSTADTQISIRNAVGTLIPYFGSAAFNDDEFETLDSILIDLTIPADGTYYFQVNAFSVGDTGEYELFAYRFNGAVPEPATVALVLAAAVLGATRRRR